MLREVVIHSFNELQNEVFSDVWDGQLMRYRDNKVYRGMEDKSWGCLPSLNRACPHDLTLEKQMLRSFKKYGYADLPQNMSFWQLLALAQQFGLPTRLLDWTYSPLVAAHFVTENVGAYDQDGAILCADMKVFNKYLPDRLRNILDEERTCSFSFGMLDSLAGSFEELKTLSDKPFALFFEPASAVDRIANQYALFSLSTDPVIRLDELPGADEAIRRIVIPKEIKLEIRDKLDYINISERMIYPGLGGIAKWITRRFSDLGPKYNQNNFEK